MHTRLVSLCLVISLMIIFVGIPTPAHAADFSFTCANPYIIISSGGITVFQVTKTQVAAPLDIALDTGSHQFIASANGASLWALSSNEFQVHWDYNPDGTKVIVNANVCGSLNTYLRNYLFHCTGQGIAITRGGTEVLSATYSQLAGPLYTAIVSGYNQYITSKSGVSLWALKSDEFQVHRDANPDGTKVIVSADMCGVIPAVINTTTINVANPPASTYQNPGTVQSGASTYIVRSGDNLFRISLKFGRTMAQIANANGIANYNLIYVGQVLIIP